jgi:hypothetical protein
LLDKCDIEITDLLPEPLLRTVDGDFEFPAEAAESAGLADVLSPDEYKALLSNVIAWPADVVALSRAGDATYTAVVAPYLHHHLNLLDKELACGELYRVTKPGGICAIGDLSFSYEAFCQWLGRHAGEDIPYALECFISRREHQRLLGDTHEVVAHDGTSYYAFACRKA